MNYLEQLGLRHPYWIYCITNMVNGKKYIGKWRGKNPNDRWNGHKWISKQTSSKYEKYSKYPIYKALRKYGVEHFNFEVIACCWTETDLNYTEQFLIKYYNTFTRNKGCMGYNATMGGGGVVGRKWTEKQHQEAKEFDRTATSKENHYLWNKSQPQSVKEKISKTKSEVEVIALKKPRPNRRGDNCPAIIHRKRYSITFKDGRVIEILGLKRFCRDFGYDANTLMGMRRGLYKKHKDIIKIEKLD